MKASDRLPAEWNAAAHFVDRNVAEGRGHAPAYVFEDRTLRYSELLELVDRAGNALAAQGVGRGDRVLLLCLDAPEFVAAFWGAIKLGAVPVPLNTLLRAADYSYLFKDSGARALVVSARLLPEVEPILSQVATLERVLVAGAHGRHVSWDECLAGADRTLPAARTGRDDPAFWLYSSGSTGFPKGAVHLHHDMFVCAETFAKQVLGIHAGDRVLSAPKLFFAYGLGNAGYFPLSVGAHSLLFADRPQPETLLQRITLHRPTLFFAVPTLYAGMLAVERPERFDLKSLRLCVSAGEALPPDLYRRWRERFGVELLDGMGTTESLHMFLSNRAGEVRPGSAGVPVPGYVASVVDDHGRPVPDGEMGHLRIQGDSVMDRYWNQPEKTKAALVDGWLHTGDRCSRDADGYFFYCGRGDDMLKVGGIWVSPVEVEAALVAHDAVLESAVVGHEDADGLVKPKAFVVLKDAAQASPRLADELRAFVKGRIASYKAPRWVEFKTELPKTATGKIQRFKLRA